MTINKYRSWSICPSERLVYVRQRIYEYRATLHLRNQKIGGQRRSKHLYQPLKKRKIRGLCSVKSCLSVKQYSQTVYTRVVATGRVSPISLFSSNWRASGRGRLWTTECQPSGSVRTTSPWFVVCTHCQKKKRKKEKKKKKNGNPMAILYALVNI